MIGYNFRSVFYIWKITQVRNVLKTSAVYI